MKPINEELPDPKSPCPFCKEPVSDYNEDCSRCLNYVPYCIASGKYHPLYIDMLLLMTWPNANTASSTATTAQ